MNAGEPLLDLGDGVPEALGVLLADQHRATQDAEALGQDADVAGHLVEAVDDGPKALLHVHDDQAGLVAAQQILVSAVTSAMRSALLQSSARPGR